MRKPLMAGNWKMYKTPAETHEFFEAFKPIIESSAHCDIAICPPFPNIHAAVKEAAGTPIGIGAQNLYWGREGAVTGEVSGHMLQAIGCKYVIIAHSERRQYFGGKRARCGEESSRGARVRSGPHRLRWRTVGRARIGPDGVCARGPVQRGDRPAEPRGIREDRDCL